MVTNRAEALQPVPIMLQNNPRRGGREPAWAPGAYYRNNNQARWHARRAGRTAVLGIASTELALAYILCIVAAVVCVVYGVIKWNDAGPLTEELREINSDPGE